MREIILPQTSVGYKFRLSGCAHFEFVCSHNVLAGVTLTQLTGAELYIASSLAALCSKTKELFTNKQLLELINHKKIETTEYFEIEKKNPVNRSVFI